ncbi:MAG: hypothetical protein U1F10_15500 [Burkholderiales bacterium]
MRTIFQDLANDLLGAGGMRQRLAVLERAYAEGDRFALLEALLVCGLLQAVIPDWAVDALVDVDRNLASGELEDLNEALGWQAPSQARRKKERQKELQTELVLGALARYRVDGGPLNAEEAFAPVAAELGIGRRLVETIYKESGAWIKGLPKNAGNYAFSLAGSPFPRRRGRPTYADRCETCGTQFSPKAVSD